MTRKLGAKWEVYRTAVLRDYFGANIVKVNLLRFTLPSGEVLYEEPQGYSGEYSKVVVTYLKGRPETKWKRSLYEKEWSC